MFRSVLSNDWIVVFKVNVSTRVQIFTEYLSVWYFLYQLISLQPNNKCVDVLLLTAKATANKVGIMLRTVSL